MRPPGLRRGRNLPARPGWQIGRSGGRTSGSQAGGRNPCVCRAPRRRSASQPATGEGAAGTHLRRSQPAFRCPPHSRNCRFPVQVAPSPDRRRGGVPAGAPPPHATARGLDPCGGGGSQWHLTSRPARLRGRPAARRCHATGPGPGRGSGPCELPPVVRAEHREALPPVSRNFGRHLAGAAALLSWPLPGVMATAAEGGSQPSGPGPCRRSQPHPRNQARQGVARAVWPARNRVANQGRNLRRESRKSAVRGGGNTACVCEVATPRPASHQPRHSPSPSPWVRNPLDGGTG